MGPKKNVVEYFPVYSEQFATNIFFMLDEAKIYNSVIILSTCNCY